MNHTDSFVNSGIALSHQSFVTMDVLQDVQPVTRPLQLNLLFLGPNSAKYRVRRLVKLKYFYQLKSDFASQMVAKRH